jgi:SET domain-containing protein
MDTGENCAILFLISVGIYIVVWYIFYKNDDIDSDLDIEPVVEYIVPSVTIKDSKLGGRGVFSTKSYVKGDSIEICPCIKQSHKNSVAKINDYTFTYDSKNDLVAFGYCSIYNHSDTPNAMWDVLNSRQMKIYALKSISPGEEMLISYGNTYFNDRAHLSKN